MKEFVRKRRTVYLFTTGAVDRAKVRQFYVEKVKEESSTYHGFILDFGARPLGIVEFDTEKEALRFTELLGHKSSWWERFCAALATTPGPY